MTTTLAIGTYTCMKDVLAEIKANFKEIMGETYEEKVSNIIQNYDKDNSFRNNDFFKTRIGKELILLSTSYYKSWVECDPQGQYKISKKSDEELKKLYLNPILIKLQDQELFIKSEKVPPTQNKLDKNARNKVNDKTRNKCLKAKDYAGCMEYESRN